MTRLAYQTQLTTLADEIDDKVHHETPTMRANVVPTDEAIGGDDSPEARVVKVCKGCMRSLPEDASFCPECGEEPVSIRRVPDMYLDEVVGGKYRIVEKVGQGGMGEVYRAVNDSLGHNVAVKFLSKKFAGDENLVARFLNEAKSYCRVNHPNAVTLLDYGQHDDAALFIITEFVEGKNVTETLKAKGPLDAETVLDVGVQIAEVLSAAHGQGVIHRDLKPDNIMLMPLSRGRYAVKVLDFGIAKIVDEEDGPNTETGSVFGTPEFMSPEQARGDDADGRSDIYALGVIMFYMLTGKLPFRGKNKLVVLNMQLNDPPPRPREVYPETDLSARFESLIMKCLNKGREQRYDSADDLLEAFEELRIPGGHVTSKVTAQRAANDTPILRNGWNPSDGEADTLASLETKAPEWDIESIEMNREHRPETAEQRDPSPVVIGVSIIAVLSVAALLILSFGGGDSEPAGTDPVEAVAVEQPQSDGTEPSATKPDGDAPKEVVNAVAAPQKKDPVKTSTSPKANPPAEKKPEVKPAPPVEPKSTKPASAEPKATEPVEVKPDERKRDETVQPDPPKVSEKTEPSKDEKTEKKESKDAEPLPEDMALPPRTLDE